MRRGLVLGAGGVLGFTWTLARLARFARESGWDPRQAHAIVGTSSGAIIAAQLGAGLSIDALFAAHRTQIACRSGGSVGRSARRPAARTSRHAWRPAAPQLLMRATTGDPRWLSALVGLLPAGRGSASRLSAAVAELPCAADWVAHPRTAVVAMDLETGRRRAFGLHARPTVSVLDAVTASCAVPGLMAPVVVQGHRYVDGAAISSTSADLLLGDSLDEIVVVAPLVTPPQRLPRGLQRVPGWLLRHLMHAAWRREERLLKAAGQRFRLLAPSTDESAMWWDHLMDPDFRTHVMQNMR